jgi:hypothetical protein
MVPKISKPFLLGVVTDQDEGGKETANNDPQVQYTTATIELETKFSRSNTKFR